MAEITETTKREKVRYIPIEKLHDFPNHPFLVKDDEEMAQLVESIRMNGILTPIIARMREDGDYECVAGHRRKCACMKLGISVIPTIVRTLSRDEAVLAMVDSNLQREKLLPSERAKAYQMKMDAMKRQGKRTDLTLSPAATKLEIDSASEIGKQLGDSRDQVFRYIRLNYLRSELLKFVDDGKLGLRQGVELSYLQEEEQCDIGMFIDDNEVFPSHDQTIRMRKISKEGGLDTDKIYEIMGEKKPNQREGIKISFDRLGKYFDTGMSKKKMEETIIKALDLYMAREREGRDAR